jgi:TPP-dependent pyruvate/acetoin dehydrogenase alpha subunit
MSSDSQRQIYQTMRLIRRFEQRVVGLVDANEIGGVTHEYIGQEAVAAGVCSVLRSGDLITSTHRGHGHLLARGADPSLMMAELMGRTTGLNRGRGGSMHVADFKLGILGANGIVAAGAPIAVGAASQMRHEDRVAVAFFGDGGINQGVLHEAINMAAIWRLPVLFCCENNGYAVTMPATEASLTPIVERMGGYGIPAQAVDGMDPAAVAEATTAAVEHARNGNGPSFLECRTYRFVGHHTAERTMNLRYRTDEEMALWVARDPIPMWANRLVQDGIMTRQELEAIDSEVESTLDTAVEFGRASPVPRGEDALDFVYASGRSADFPAKGWVEFDA